MSVCASIRVSIDTDESSSLDSATEQKSRTDFLIAMTQFMQSIGPMVSAGTIGFDQAKQMLLFAARAFPRRKRFRRNT
jgi:hypothetical protein